MSRVLLPFPAQAALAQALAPALQARVGRLQWRRFPDRESLVAVEEDLQGCDVVLLAGLADPDEKALALRFSAATAREFGARSVGLIAPYLPYMRQDRRFHPGEAVSAPLFARFLEESFDWLVTVDPHLHRIQDLAQVYRIPTRCIRSASLLAEWIGRQVPDAVLIGPDSESGQWVQDIAERAGLPWQVLSKIRRGDREVEVSLPEPERLRGRTPVLVDDIISSGRTLIETLGHLRGLGQRPAVCVVIHALFPDSVQAQLLAAGAARVVSTDSVPHPSNAIALAGVLADAAAGLLDDRKLAALSSADQDRRALDAPGA